MKKWLSNLLIVALLVIGLVLLYLTNTGVISFGRSYIQQLSSELPGTAEPTAFKNVNLIPMEGEQLVESQTVIVRDGLISFVGASDKVEVSERALVVDGRGKYLMPGVG